MSMFNIPINRLHFIVCIKRANRKNRHNLYDTNLPVSIRNLKITVYPVKISAFAGMTGYVVINEALYRIGVWNLFEFWDLGFVILKRV
jgi:hypothetical protein